MTETDRNWAITQQPQVGQKLFFVGWNILIYDTTYLKEIVIALVYEQVFMQYFSKMGKKAKICFSVWHFWSLVLVCASFPQKRRTKLLESCIDSQKIRTEICARKNFRLDFFRVNKWLKRLCLPVPGKQGTYKHTTPEVSYNCIYCSISTWEEKDLNLNKLSMSVHGQQTLIPMDWIG